MIGRRPLALLALALALVAAACGGGGGETASCGGGAHSKVSVWTEHERFGAAFELAHAHPGASWRLIAVHEGRVAWRGHVRTSARGGLKVVRRFPDYAGADHVTFRAVGPR